MKKVMLVFALLLVSFFCINVKAEGVENVDTPVVENEEIKEVKEEVKEEVKAEVKVEAEPTRAEATSDGDKVEEVELDPKAEELLHQNGKHRACVYFMNSYDGSKIKELCTPEGSSSNKTFPSSQYSLLNDFTKQGVKYSFKGWYDENGELITTERGIQVHLDNPVNGCYIIYVYAKWNEMHEPIYNFNVYDSISTGSHSWSNTVGHNGSYTYTFSTPDAKTHYSLVYYKLGENTFQPGESYTHDITAQGYNTNVTEEAYAYWQADVTVNLYSDGKLVSSESSFESVTINDLEDKDYEDFIGWVDEDGNEVTEKTFYPNEMGTKPEPVEITLYAKYKLVRKDIEVTKVWADEDNENKRPSSVTVTLKASEEEIDEAELNEDNEWTHTFEKVNIYNEDNEEINYTVEEKEVPEGYEVSYEETEEGFIIHNVLGKGDGELDNPQTGSNIILYLITLLISIIGLIGGKLCLRENN